MNMNRFAWVALLIVVALLTGCEGADAPDDMGQIGGNSAGGSAVGGAGGGTGGMGGTGNNSAGGAGGGRESCDGCWADGRCVPPAEQTLDVAGAGGADCKPVPLNCTGQAAAPCPTNTAPAQQLAWRGTVAFCCPANMCTFDACQKAPL